MKWKKIISLIKVFLNNFYQNSKIFNGKRGKLNIRSNFFWMIVMITLAIAFISYKIIHFLVTVGQPQIFLYLYFIILAIILMFQIILISTNVLFFSKELEYVLPMPVSSLELLLAKYGVFLIITYIAEITFGLIPLIIYGLLNFSFSYFVLMPIVLILFPILLVTIISLITVLLMGLARYIKNKDTYQRIVTVLLLLIVMVFENMVINDFAKNTEKQQELTNEQISYQSEEISEIYREFGKGFLIVNPSAEILSSSGKWSAIFKNILLLVFYNVVTFLIFIGIGKRIYLKNILLGTTKTTKITQSKEIKKIDGEKAKSVRRAYILKDMKQLYRNPTFFMQMVFPVIILLVSALIIGSVVIPLIDRTIQSDENIKASLKSLTFNSEMVCVILGVLQVLFSMSSLSLTAISREGKNATFLKYIPIDLYKQFLYKNVLQVILNTIVSIVVLGIIYFLVSKISLLQILLLFVTSIFISLINSFLMLVVDLKRPMLNWDSEYILVKKNENKIFQYVLMIVIILALLYMGNILKELQIELVIVIQAIFFALVFIIINLLVRKNYKKLFKKII